MGKHLDARQDFLRPYSRLVLSFLGGPLKVTNLLQDQLVANWWPRSDMEFFLLKGTNKIEEAQETIKKHEERLGVQIFK